MQLQQTLPTVLPVSYEQYMADMKKRAEKPDSLDKEGFMNLLIAQLQNQDPLNPMDNAEFTQQTTAFSQLEQMIAMNKSLASMLEYQQQQQTSNDALMSAVSFVGKEIEYNTNVLSITDNGNSVISFYASEAATSATVNIFDSSGQLVETKTFNNVAKGANAFPWDGTGMGGAKLPNGTYSFQIAAKSAAGNPVTVGTFGSGTVTGVKTSSGIVYLEVNNGLVPFDTVYSVKNPTAAGGS